MPRSVRGWDDVSFWVRCGAVAVPASLVRAITLAQFERYASCYDATAIAPLLRGLASHEVDLRAQCLLRLADEIEHQGSTWDSSQPVVRFLAKALDDGFYAEEEEGVFGLLRTANLWALLPAPWRKAHAARIPKPIHRTLDESGVMFVPHARVLTIRNGAHREFHANGVLKLEGYYVDDREHGLFREWDDAGELVLEQTFADGKRHGVFLEWKAGVKRVEGAYRRGKRHGTFRIYDEAGVLTKTVEWAQGKPLRG